MSYLYKRGELIPLEDLMRLLAKSNTGRTEWIMFRACKGGTQLFEGRTLDWTAAQRMFVSWCLYYDNVYEAYDRPPDRVIEDDKLLEQWQKRQNEKMEIQAEKNWAESASVSGDIKTAWDYPEIITFDEEQV